MNRETLQKAREFEAQYGPYISDTDRPAFHLTPTIGWMNDPNGFSCYKGEYHLFYQYHPYSTEWGPMHWGHAKTRDFLHWERLPVAMAPDQEYDKDGCFSGSAVELDDGRQMLVYTGVRKHMSEDGRTTETQTQCLAFGDGINYEKWPGNPVLDGSGSVLLYRSADGIRWTLVGVVDASHSQYGQMWECPDFFRLDGKQVLFVSPQEMSPIGLEFHAGNGTVCLIGSYDAENNQFTRESVQAIDYGIDFYAPQTLETPDGRRIMVGWMQNWNTLSCKPRNCRWFGQMSIPRELSIHDGRLYQNPVRELEQYRCHPVSYRNVLLSGETSLNGVEGRTIDMTVEIRPAGRELYHCFRIHLAGDGEHVTSIRYRPDTSVLKIDRTRSGSNADVVHTRSLPVHPRDGRLKLRILMDRFSVEIFANDGETAASMAIFTRQEASAISFDAEGPVRMDVEKYDINMDQAH